VGWVVALFVVALVLRFGAGAEALAWGILFVIMPLSGVFYPVRALPGFLQPVAAVLPTTHAFIAGRMLLTGGQPWHQLGLAALTTVGCGVVVLAFLQRMLVLFRRRGYIARYT
jgi:ABC-2 type transport system permease protein